MRLLRRFWITCVLLATGPLGCSSTTASTDAQPGEDLGPLAQPLGADATLTSSNAVRSQCPQSENAASPVGDRRIPFMPANDLQFIDFFIAHHVDAVEMADMVIDRGTADEVKGLARNIHDAQTKEIDELRATRQQLTGSTDAEPPPPDSHMMSEMEHMKSMSGAELDYDFLEEMIPHHGSGIAPARYAVPHLCRFNLVRMAIQIYANQAQEIGNMIELLKQRAGDPVPAHHEDVDTHDGADIGFLGDQRVTMTPLTDVEFIDFFVPHHEDAVMMAEQVVERGVTPDVRDLATRIVQSQSDEIAKMKAARAELTGTAEPTPPPESVAMQETMQRMMNMSGLGLDIMFLVEMIPHHSAGLGPAHRARMHLTDIALVPIADQIYTTQAQEVGEMRDMLLRLVTGR